jgi:hypothetical protein
MIEALSKDDEALLTHCRRIAWAITADAYGEQRAERIDLETLQRLVDDGVCPPDDEWGLQSLGVSLGDLLCGAGFQWVAIDWQDQRSLAVAWRGKSVTISAPSLIQKRVEEGEDCDVTAIYHWAVQLGREKDAGT